LVFGLFLIIFDGLFILFDSIRDIGIVKNLQLIYKHLKIASYKKFNELDLGWHTRNNSGALVKKVESGVQKVDSLLESMAWDLIPTIIQAVLSLILLTKFAWQVGLLHIIALYLFFWISQQGYKAVEKLRETRHDMYENESKKLIEDIQHISSIWFSGNQSYFQKNYDQIHDQIVFTGNQEIDILINKYNKLRILILNVTTRTSLFILAFYLHQNWISIAVFVYLMTLTEKLSSSFWRLSRLIDLAAQASEPAKRLVELLNQTSNIQAGYLEKTKGYTISFKNVNFAYSKEDGMIIKNLSIEIPEGYRVGLVGSSGSGKSTFLELLKRSYDTTTGEVLIGGVNIKALTKAKLHQIFGIVPQEVSIFDSSIWDNLVMGNTSLAAEQVMKACKKARIHEFIISQNLGYQTQCGEKGIRLSGGQKQRLAIARALLKEAHIYLLDEATSAQDSTTEREIQKLAFKAFKGTIIMIAHRLSTVKDCDLILVMDNGQIIEQGTHTELMKVQGKYHELVQKQQL
jgi:ATP-binding cassette, subfamily B, heavy metal transporter